MAAVMDAADNELVGKLGNQFPGTTFIEQQTFDNISTLWVPRDKLLSVLDYLKRDCAFEMLFDLCGVDETKKQTQ